MKFEAFVFIYPVPVHEKAVCYAALRLHISQPAISGQIRDLEDEISIRLFERSARALSLTVAGRKFLEEARSVFNQGKAGLWPIGRPAAIDVAPSNGRFHSQDSRGARP